jgi:protein import protein ZIM17
MRRAAALFYLTGAGSLLVLPPRPAAWPAAAYQRHSPPRAQLVRVQREDDDNDDRGEPGDDGEDDDGTILSVSQVEDADGRALEATGRSVASVQFMITRAMRAQLSELGYATEEVDRMDPPRAASIIAKRVPSSKQAQKKPKSKRERFELQFTCNVCDAPNSHSISRHAYSKGTVLVTCPGCQSAHVIADNLNWIEDDFRNIEEYMARRGTPVTRLVADGVAESAAANASGAVSGPAPDEVEPSGPRPDPPRDPRRPWAGTKPGLEPVDGITDEQARRIREAVRKNKRRARGDDEER